MASLASKLFAFHHVHILGEIHIHVRGRGIELRHHKGQSSRSGTISAHRHTNHHSSADCSSPNLPRGRSPCCATRRGAKSRTLCPASWPRNRLCTFSITSSTCARRKSPTLLYAPPCAWRQSAASISTPPFWIQDENNHRSVCRRHHI